MKEKNSSIVKKAFVSTVPVMAGYAVLGIGFGIIMKSKGFGVLWSFLMSFFIYAGSLQYVGIELLAGGASFATIALTSLLVNVRHLFYGLSMIEKFKSAGKTKPYLIFSLTDETYSLLVADNKEIPSSQKNKYYFLVSLFDQIYWVLGSVAGSLLGSFISFNTKGLDFALTALFVTIFIDQWRSGKRHLPAVLGVVISAVCLVVFGADNFLIPSMLIITASMFAIRKKEDCVNED